MASNPVVGQLATTLEAVMKAAKNLNNISPGQATVTIQNNTPCELKLKDGDAAAPYIIYAGCYQSFVTTDSNGHVTYVGSNNQGTTCEWYLSWDVPQNDNKVKVRCSASPSPSNKVCAPEGSTSVDEDEVTKTYAAAQIDRVNASPPLGCAFGALPNTSN